MVQSNILNNIIKTTNVSYNVNNNIINVDPGFVSSAAENFELTSTSIGLKKGINLGTDPYFNNYLNKDLIGITRVFPSTLGCLEKL